MTQTIFESLWSFSCISGTGAVGKCWKNVSYHPSVNPVVTYLASTFYSRGSESRPHIRIVFWVFINLDTWGSLGQLNQIWMKATLVLFLCFVLFYKFPFGHHLSLLSFSQVPVSTNSGEVRFAIKSHHFSQLNLWQATSPFCAWISSSLKWGYFSYYFLGLGGHLKRKYLQRKYYKEYFPDKF